jgi:FkbM family methyltransferase
VGAGEPDVESVTRSFYDRGWSGINVEPAEGAWRRLSERRPRDINLQLAVGNAIGSRPFFLIDEGNGLSTLREDVAKVHSANGHMLDEVHCPVVTLARLCEDHVARPIHFLKIDVEGAEREVLEGADFEHYRPWIILVEATYPNSAEPTHSEWEDLVTTSGYRLAYTDGLNRFYVAEERWHRLAEAFAQPPNIFDNFIRADEARAITHVKEMDQVASAAKEQVASAERRAATAEARAAEAEVTVEAALSALGRARAERDAYEQEMFEVDRHAAWVSQERQNLAWSIDKHQRKIDALEREIEYHRQWIQAVYSSTSWKFARPIRAARKLLNLMGRR